MQLRMKLILQHSGLSQLPYSLSHFIEFYSKFLSSQTRQKKTTEASAKRDKDIMYG